MRYLDIADFLLVAEAVTGLSAEVLGASDHLLALADSALNAPRAGYGGVEFYRDLPQKAAILASRLARNHPLPDGNKRVAFLCLVEFAERNSWRFARLDGPEAEEEVAQTITSLAAGELSEMAFAAWLADRLIPAGE